MKNLLSPDKLAEIFRNNLTRLLKGRRPSWLAKESKLAQSTIGRILDGDMKPSFDTIAPLAEALTIHPVEFFVEPGVASSIERKVSLEADQIVALKQVWREMAETELHENPAALAAAENVPADILEALANYEGDWNLLRAMLDLPEPKKSVTKKKVE